MWKTLVNNKEIWKIPSFQNHAVFFLISFPSSQALYAVYFLFLWFLSQFFVFSLCPSYNPFFSL